METDHDGALHHLEEELHTKIYPGTEIMADVGSHHFVKSSLHSKQVLVPQPSNDKHDPLNWNRRWKFAVISLSTTLSFAQGLGPLALAPMFGQLIESFHSDLASVVRFTGVCILVLGFSNFIWVPMSQTIGRRPVAILSSLICLASMIWRAKATTYSSFMGACILNGIGAGPSESLQPQVIADTQFLHDRGAYNTLYFTFYFGSLMVGPIISGPMAYHVGWPNFWWLNVALFAVLIVLLIFFFPETKWHREQSLEADTVTLPPAEQVQTPRNPKDEITQPAEIESTKNEVEPVDEWLHRGSPSKSQFNFWKLSPEPVKTMAITLWIPWKLHFFPIVEFAAFVVSWSASVFLTVNLTQSQVFAAPPYNWSSQSIGFTNFATFIGALIGLATNGPLSDWISMRATRKNNGVREPEMRLPAMIPYVLIAILGNFIVAYGYQNSWDWRIIVIIGYTCSGIQVAALPAIASTYAVDSYKPIAGSLFVNITINKNLWGYGFNE
ncbi:Major facilitator superfamily domain, general substrate transporter [Penicillium occitanis (nom. inval.)]|nr:Major facilitator superfamily domain, general substrate transporter [Penicillium occitanis (nom. inval.)]PCG94862.1 hypothetical protein PENOC_080600 [Penicillium occitanis (nom. inval.)]